MPSSFQCENGEISNIECKKGWFGMTSCENKTLTCEQKSFCCPKPLKTTKPPKSGMTTDSNGIAESIGPSSTSQNPKEGCERCDLAARHSCFLSLHIDSNSTAQSLNPDCVVCENCCDDALPHKCEVWKNHDFCDMAWYSRDKKQILCGRTCGLC
uniref:ShKT domain-containing protein n=1 Tax=Caenorhabditis tropicalis TaxID=1561998 RepID=A0A1I7UDG3_9PELO